MKCIKNIATKLEKVAATRKLTQWSRKKGPFVADIATVEGNTITWKMFTEGGANSYIQEQIDEVRIKLVEFVSNM
ncbi:unnamed protein product [Prunus armeniaca]